MDSTELFGIGSIQFFRTYENWIVYHSRDIVGMNKTLHEVQFTLFEE